MNTENVISRELTVMVISIGVPQPHTGKHKYSNGEDGWNLFDNQDALIYLTAGGRLLYARPNSFEVGDNLTLRNNDSGRKQGTDTIVDVAIADREDLLEVLKKNGYDYYPLRPFKSRPKGNRKIQTSFSVKGTCLTSEYKK